MKMEHPRAQSVVALENHRLRIKWDTGETLEVDVGEVLRKFPSLKPLLRDREFAKVHIAGNGSVIEWIDCELGADNVFAWTREQMGEMSHEMFSDWMRRNNLDLDQAAAAIGMSRRMIAYYQCGRKPIPKTVWLACLGWETLSDGARAA